MLNFAIVGMGRWGVRLVDSIQGRSAKAYFSTAVSRDPDRLSPIATERGIVVVGALGTVLKDADIDGIVIATPHSLHAEQVVACAKAGKSVFVEKPFTLSSRSAECAINAAREAGVVLAVGHNRRFLAAYAEVCRAVQSGDLGDLLHIEANFSDNGAPKYPPDHWRLTPGESPCGGLAGSGIHMIDAIIGLGGMIARVYASSARRAGGTVLDATTSALLTLESGATATLTNIAATSPIFRLHAFGTRGSIEMRSETTLEYRLLGGEIQRFSLDAVDTERAELEAFADGLTGRWRYPIPIDEVRNGIAALEAVARSAATGASVNIRQSEAAE